MEVCFDIMWEYVNQNNPDSGSSLILWPMNYVKTQKRHKMYVATKERSNEVQVAG